MIHFLHSWGKSLRINTLPFTPEQQRLLVNLDQHYEVWRAASRRLTSGRLKWKTINDREYLYRVSNRIDTSLGPRNSDTEKLYTRYELDRETKEQSTETLHVDGALYRALRLPMIPAFAGRVLRELDIREMLGTSLLVVGTMALPAYEIEANERILSAFETTDDFDLTWSHPVLGKSEPEPPNALLAALKSVDGTYTPNTEREFQIRNARGQEVELLLAASLSQDWSPQQVLKPVPLPEQDWLLWGEQISQVTCDMDQEAARLVVPDPRWFGLHKLWLSQKPARNPHKKDKDKRQGIAVLDLVRNRMPRFPMDAKFENQIPSLLMPYYEAWRNTEHASDEA